MRPYLLAAALAVTVFTVAAVVAGSSSAKADEMPCTNCQLLNGATGAEVTNIDAGGWTNPDGGCLTWLLPDAGVGGCRGWLYADGGPTGTVMPLTVIATAGAKLAMQCPRTSAFPSGQVNYYEPGSATTPGDGGQVHAVVDSVASPDPYGIALRASNDRMTIGAVDGGGFDCNIFVESP